MLVKVPAAAALFIGVLLGALSAIVFQPEAIKEIAGEEMSFVQSYYSTMSSMSVETQFETGNALADKLLKAKGMEDDEYYLAYHLRHGIWSCASSYWSA